MLLAITALTFLTVFILAYMLLTSYAPVAGVAQIRLKALDKLLERRADMDEELATPFSQRILSPLSGTVAARWRQRLSSTLILPLRSRTTITGWVPTIEDL